jgi:hypothetical protein
MRIGLLGPTDDEDAFREAVTFLLTDAEADRVIFLGEGEMAQRAIDGWAQELAGDDPEESFLERAAALAIGGRPDELEALLARDAEVARLGAIRKLPPPPARAVEMLDDRLVLFVHDKSVLDEEDIANANIIVYGKASESDLRRFGRRVFFTPGPLRGGRVGLLEAADDGVTLGLYDLAGVPIWRESLAQLGTKVMVSS